MDQNERRAELEKCLAAWRAVTRLAPNNVDAASSLGIALADAGLHDEAVRILAEVARARPASGSALANLGWAMCKAGAYNSAIRQLREAARLDAHSARTHCHLGLTLKVVGRLEEAVIALRRAAALAPGWSTVYLNLGLVLRDLGDLHGAHEVLLKGAAQTSSEDIRTALAEVSAQIGSLVDGAPPARPAPLTGELRSLQPPQLLATLFQQRSTGTLMLATREGGGLVHLLDGGISGAWAPSTPRLGEVLKRRGVVSDADLERALTIQLASLGRSERIGGILARNDLVPKPAVVSALEWQIDLALAEIVRWTEGTFSYRDDVTPHVRASEDLDIHIETPAAIARAVHESTLRTRKLQHA